MSLCKSYCQHGGRCESDAGHDGLHDSGYCTWTDAEALTHEAADEVLRTKTGGDMYLDYIQPIADGIESYLDEQENQDV